MKKKQLKHWKLNKKWLQVLTHYADLSVCKIIRWEMSAKFALGTYWEHTFFTGARRNPALLTSSNIEHRNRGPKSPYVLIYPHMLNNITENLSNLFPLTHRIYLNLSLWLLLASMVLKIFRPRPCKVTTPVPLLFVFQFFRLPSFFGSIIF